MKKAKWFLFLALVGFLLLPSHAVNATRTPKNSLPLFHGEVLKYSITWQNLVNAGTATLSITTSDDTYHIKSVALSADWLNTLGIKVKDVITAESHIDLTKSYIFVAQINEGNFHKKKTIEFDHKKKKIIYIDNDQKPELFDLHGQTLDVLSAMYLVRSQEFKVGDSIDVTVYDDKKLYDAKTVILGKETITIGEKSIKTFRTQVLLKSEGIFHRKGDLFIWFTDDERKIPVVVQCEVFLGSFYAIMTNTEIL